MVSQKEVESSNALINDATTSPRVAVFVGGTSGIGKYTLEALVKTGASLRIYLIGRPSSSEKTQQHIKELNSINPKAEILWTEGEITLLSESQRVCNVIKTKESRLDLLFLSVGYAPFHGRVETTEGIEIVQSLEYYCRMVFIFHLLPLLNNAEAGRVVSVLGGGMERITSIDLEDFDLKRPGNFGAIKAQGQYITMHTMALDKLARENPEVTFIHSWPGWVNTGNIRRGSGPILSWFAWLIFEPIIGLFAIRDADSGQRHLFQSTSAYYGGRGIPWKGKEGINTLEKTEDGLFLVNYKCDCTPNAKVMPVLREKALDKVWNHTQQVLRPYL